MGVVYRAQDENLDRAVAIKVLHPHFLDDATARSRFQREIRTMVGIEHPNVIAVYDAGFDGGHLFVVMRW